MQNEENQSVASKKEGLLTRLKGKYPDKEFGDEEALYGQIGDDYDQYEQELEGYKGREQALSDMFVSDPRSASFLQSFRKGEDPAIALVRLFGEDIREAIDDPEKQEELAAANKEFVERVAQSKTLEAEYEENLRQSLEELERIQSEEGLKDEDVDKAMELVMRIVSEGVQGKFSKETIQLALRAINYEADIATASHTAEVRGRNAKIEEKLRQKEAGDGLAHLDSGSVPALTKRKPQTIFSVADEAR